MAAVSLTTQEAALGSAPLADDRAVIRGAGGADVQRLSPARPAIPRLAGRLAHDRP